MDEFKLDEIKTKKFVEVLNNVKAEKALVVVDDGNKNVVLSGRNVADVQTTPVNGINVYDVLKHDSFVITKAGVAAIEEVYA